MTMNDFKDKVMLLTGAAHGFGYVIAEEAARRGMRLALLDIDAPALDAAEKRMVALGAEVIAIPTDVTDENAVDAAIDQTMARYHRIDVLINDAGVGFLGQAWELPTRDWEWILHANVMSQVYTMRRVIPIMLAQKDPAAIVNVASVAGLATGAGMAAYHASKFAAVGATEATAYDLQRMGANIQMHVMCPGFVQTDLHHSEAHRPERYTDTTDAYYKSAAYKMGQQAIEHLITTGIPIDTIAHTVFKSLKDGTFYILTHPEYIPAISARVQRIVGDGKLGTE